MDRPRDSQGRFISNSDASALLGRQLLSKRAGLQFGTDRDVDTVLGYKKNPDLADYKSMYDRRGIASTIVDAPAKTTWRKPPVIDDGTEGKSAFSKDWKELRDRLKVFQYLERADRLAGIGRYSVLLIGTSSSDLKAELSGLHSVKDVIFLSAFSEEAAKIKDFVTTTTLPRFGQPESYVIDLGGVISSAYSEKVHWSRVIHVAEGLLEDEVYGEPRLQKVYNRLQDLDKVVGGSAEGYWQSAAKGYAISPREGYELTPGSKAATKEEFQLFVHGLQRVLALEGLDVKELKGESLNPANVFDVILSLISGKTGIPKRILLGSERGDLASSQDEANWLGRISERQMQFAEPDILRRFIDRLIEYNVLSPPAGGDYTVTWPGLFYLTDEEKAMVNLRNATAMKNLAGLVTQGVISKEELRKIVEGVFNVND